VEPNLHSPVRHLIELTMAHADCDALTGRASLARPVDEPTLRRITKRRQAPKDENSGIRHPLCPDGPD
jgi:hypothetical protein